MQVKRLLIFLLLTATLTIGWIWANTYLKEKHPDWYIDPPPADQTSQNQTPSTSPTTQTAATAPLTQPAGIHAVPGEGKPAEIGYFKFDRTGTFSQYPLGLALDPQGASISSATLNRLRAHVGKDDPYVFQKPYKDLDPASSHSLITQAVTINGQRIDLHNLNWSLTQSDE